MIVLMMIMLMMIMLMMIMLMMIMLMMIMLMMVLTLRRRLLVDQRLVVQYKESIRAGAGRTTSTSTWLHRQWYQIKNIPCFGPLPDPAPPILRTVFHCQFCLNPQTLAHTSTCVSLNVRQRRTFAYLSLSLSLARCLLSLFGLSQKSESRPPVTEFVSVGVPSV